MLAYMLVNYATKSACFASYQNPAVHKCCRSSLTIHVQVHVKCYRLVMCREDAVRLGLFIGGFTGSYNLLSALLNKIQAEKPAQNCMAAGTAAGQSASAAVTCLVLTQISTRQRQYQVHHLCFLSHAWLFWQIIIAILQCNLLVSALLT